MKIKFLLSFVLSLVIFKLSYSLEYKPDELIIKYKKPLNQLQAQTIKDIKELKIKVIKLPKGTDLKKAIEYYKSLPEVEYVEPNYIIKKADTVPNDPYYSQQWGLRIIGMEKVWDYCKGDRNTVVAVIDTGIDLNHEDLKDNIWKNTKEICDNGIDDDNNGYVDDCYGWNFVSNNNNVNDDDGHGSHIAGIIGAVTNNSTGVAGVNWNVQLMPLKILDANGNGNLLSFINAIKYAVDNGAKVINASLGYPDSCTVLDESQALKDAISYANSKGVLVVTAAGNYGCNNDVYSLYPANIKLPNVIAVASTDQNGNLSSFSNYGLKSVHIAAPGEGIYSTYMNNSYKSLSGTSMATPFVTGSVALLLSCRQDLDYLKIKEVLLSSVNLSESLSNKTISGGYLDIYQAFTTQSTNIKPVRPTLINLSLSSNNISVILSWQNNSSIQDSVIIQRSEDSGKTWSTIATLSSTATSYTDTNVSQGKSYNYRVIAKAGTLESIPSNVMSVNIPTTTTNSTPSSSNTPSSGGGCSTTTGSNVWYYVLALGIILLIRKLSYAKQD
jgi:subtilisin family serine protease